ncbi:MAG: ribonuclease M5 [Mycoplasmoidaceae bacterium]|nr:ribonuclease M5 [Mycoplasmoidaceae bacterium]
MNQKVKSKPTIKQIVVVEGKTDTQRLKQLFNVRTIETNGSRLSLKTINLIKKTSKTNDIVLFLDPDGPGEKIRKKLQNELDSFEQAFIKRPKGTKKPGVAEASDKQILDAFKNLKSFKKANNCLTIEQYQKLDLNTKQKRKTVTDHFGISECNNKQLFKRLNMMNIKFSELKKILK